MVIWRSSLIMDVSDRALEFILSIPYLDWRAKEEPCLEMRLAILTPTHMVPTWYSLSFTLTPLLTVACRFRKFSIKVSWSLQIRIFSSWSRWCYVHNQEIMYSTPISEMSLGVGSMYGRVQFSSFKILPLLSWYSLGTLLVFAKPLLLGPEWFPHWPRVYVDIGRAS